MAKKPIPWGDTPADPKPARRPAPPPSAGRAASSAPPAKPGPAWGEGDAQGAAPASLVRRVLASDWLRPALFWAPPAVLAALVAIAWIDMRGVAAPQVRTPASPVLVAEIVLPPGDARTVEAVCRDYDLPVRQCAASAACAAGAPAAGPRTIRLVLSRNAVGC